MSLFYINLLVFIKLFLELYTFIKKLCGYSQPKFQKAKTLQNIRNHKRHVIQDYPPFYSNGWIGILLSHQLDTEKVKHLIAFGKELVVFRKKSGCVSVIDAFCPHKGDNEILVLDNNEICCLVCSKNQDQQCKSKNLKFYTVLEQNNIIFVWHHSEDEWPQWYPEKLDKNNILSLSYSYFSSALLQDFTENTADLAHFNPVHRFIIECSNYKIKTWLAKYFHMEYNHEWPILEDERKFPFSYNAGLVIFGKKIFEIFVKGECHGITIMKTTFKIFNKDCAVVLLTNPLFYDRYKLTLVTYSDFTIGSKIYAFVIKRFTRKLFGPDFEICKNKIYIQRPVYSNGDKKIVEIRNWCQQFYY